MPERYYEALPIRELRAGALNAPLPRCRKRGCAAEEEGAVPANSLSSTCLLKMKKELRRNVNAKADECR
jgi:hypothetical protein